MGWARRCRWIRVLVGAAETQCVAAQRGKRETEREAALKMGGYRGLLP